jgi:hypothetical protein
MSSAHPAPGTTPEPEQPQPPTHERWWWTGTYRAVLGGAIVGYQSPVLTSGEASTWNWVLAAVGAAVAVWGLSMVWTAYRSRREAGVR